MKLSLFTALLVSSLSSLCFAQADLTQKVGSSTAAAASRAQLIVPLQDKAREVGETVYNTWRLGMIRGNMSAWRSSTSTARQRKLYNSIVSERGDFNRDLFGENAQPIAMLENFRYVGALSACGGKSLALTYVGRLQLGNSPKPAAAAYVLHFIQEGSLWMFDRASFFSLEKLPKLANRLMKGDAKVLQEQDGFYPYLTLPTLPRIATRPELIAKVYVDCPGREIKMMVNGHSPHEFYDVSRADVIWSGLRRGANEISYTIEDVPGLPRPSMAIGVFVMPETLGNQPAVVFEHILDASDQPKGGRFKFVVSNDQIKAMNPKYKGAKPQPFRAVPLKTRSRVNAATKASE